MMEGFGSDFYYGVILGLLTFIIMYFIIKRLCGNSPREVLIDENLEERPPVYNPNYCPICLGIQSLALETNCGHLYCGPCLQRHYNITRSHNSSGITCALCRQRVVLIFNCFTPHEWQGPLDPQTQQRKDTVLRFVREYNRSVRNDLSILERILELPVLIRHFFEDTIRGGRFGPNHVRLRLISFIIMTLFYILLPVDIFPELVYGMYGYSDDLFLFVIMTAHVLIVYRNFIANA